MCDCLFKLLQMTRPVMQNGHHECAELAVGGRKLPMICFLYKRLLVQRIVCDSVETVCL